MKCGFLVLALVGCSTATAPHAAQAVEGARRPEPAVLRHDLVDLLDAWARKDRATFQDKVDLKSPFRNVLELYPIVDSCDRMSFSNVQGCEWVATDGDFALTAASYLLSKTYGVETESTTIYVVPVYHRDGQGRWRLWSLPWAEADREIDWSAVLSGGGLGRHVGEGVPEADLCKALEDFLTVGDAPVATCIVGEHGEALPIRPAMWSEITEMQVVHRVGNLVVARSKYMIRNKNVPASDPARADALVLFQRGSAGWKVAKAAPLSFD